MLKIKEFGGLTDSEAKQLYQAPGLIAILIASADSNIQEDETDWAKKVIAYRQEVGAEPLFSYYEIADTYFDEVLQVLTTDERGVQERIAFLETELAALNPVLAKIDADFASELVNSWRSFAKQVAKSSGGFMGFGSISEQENYLISLKMIDIA
jgi:hypothetical protein